MQVPLRVLALALFSLVARAEDPLRIFLFAGQSNMVGADSRAQQVEAYPPYAGALQEVEQVRFAYSVGRHESDGWSRLSPLDGAFGPELIFARDLLRAEAQEFALIKCAVGGTNLGVDWDPAAPESGRQMYPRFLNLVRASLDELEREGRAYELAALFWHQGENDMLSNELRPLYGERLRAFLARLRDDLRAPELPVYVGEISDKGIWGMDYRRPMRELRAQQRAVVAEDPLSFFVPTSHLAFEVMGSGQPHYHFGTLGQLQHGAAYAAAWLARAASEEDARPALADSAWFAELEPSGEVDVVLLLGQRGMEAEEAWVDQLEPELAAPREDILFRAHLAGGLYRSPGWEPLGPVGPLHQFGPELSLGRELAQRGERPLALLKFADGAAQMSDWVRAHEDANRPCYAAALDFVRESLDDLRARGLRPRLAFAVVDHGENESWYSPFRQRYPALLRQLLAQLREDLDAPSLPVLLTSVHPEAPWGAEAVRERNAALAALCAEDAHTWGVALDRVPMGRVHRGTAGTLVLGQVLARRWLERFEK